MVFKDPSFTIEHTNQPLLEHRIPLKDSQLPPLRQKIYPLDSEELLALKQKIEKLMAKNRIRPSDSLYGAPILFEKRKDSGLRTSIYYGMININTVSDSYPLPHVVELLTRLKGARGFLHLDLRDGYLQLPIAQQDILKTIFSCRYGIFENLVMLMEQTNALSTFQRVMNHVFFDLLDDCVIVYLGDIRILSKTKEQHLIALQKVFSR